MGKDEKLRLPRTVMGLSRRQNIPATIAHPRDPEDGSGRVSISNPPKTNNGESLRTSALASKMLAD